MSASATLVAVILVFPGAAGWTYATFPTTSIVAILLHRLAVRMDVPFDVGRLGVHQRDRGRGGDEVPLRVVDQGLLDIARPLRRPDRRDAGVDLSHALLDRLVDRPSPVGGVDVGAEVLGEGVQRVPLPVAAQVFQGVVSGLLELEVLLGVPDWRVFGEHREDFRRGPAAEGPFLPLQPVPEVFQGGARDVRDRQLAVRDHRLPVFGLRQVVAGELQGDLLILGHLPGVFEPQFLREAPYEGLRSPVVDSFRFEECRPSFRSAPPARRSVRR